MKLIYSPSALEDIDGIWDYTFDKWGLGQARIYTEKIENTCISISKGSMRVRSFDGLPEISGFVRCERHYIFVLMNNTSVNILAVLHEKMNMVEQLSERFSSLSDVMDGSDSNE